MRILLRVFSLLTVLVIGTLLMIMIFTSPEDLRTVDKEKLQEVAVELEEIKETEVPENVVKDEGRTVTEPVSEPVVTKPVKSTSEYYKDYSKAWLQYSMDIIEVVEEQMSIGSEDMFPNSAKINQLRNSFSNGMDISIARFKEIGYNNESKGTYDKVIDFLGRYKENWLGYYDAMENQDVMKMVDHIEVLVGHNEEIFDLTQEINK